MRIKSTQQVETEVTLLIECDRCHERVMFEDMMLRQEWVIVGGSGGYGSKHWGDGTSWTADLCEKCQHNIFSPFAQIEP
jgi:hypothetical protein